MNGYWNGERCQFKVVFIKLIDFENTPTLYWAKPFVDVERQAIEVNYESTTFCIDNEDGTGYVKMTTGFGSPSYNHRSIFKYQVIRDVPQDEINIVFNKEKYDWIRSVSDKWCEENHPKEFEDFKEWRNTYNKMIGQHGKR